MNGYNRNLNTSGSKFFKKDKIIDDKTFHYWKSELKKELPSFWEEIVGKS